MDQYPEDVQTHTHTIYNATCTAQLGTTIGPVPAAGGIISNNQ